jgi:hypothetical protein
MDWERTNDVRPIHWAVHSLVTGSVKNSAEMTLFLIVAIVALRAIKQQGRYRVY